jgi:ABC-type nitrate/sulfonate/bicarbonate transport system permease component
MSLPENGRSTPGGNAAPSAPVAGPGSSRLRRGVGRLLPPLIFAAIVLGIWQLGVDRSGLSEALLPKPTSVAQALWDDRTLLRDNAWVTLREILAGDALALLLGIGSGVALAAVRPLQRAVYPWLVISQTVPIVAIAPVFVLWTGFDIRPKLMVIALVSYFPLTVTTIDGLRAADPDLLDLLRTLGGTSFHIFRMARLPAALPSLFSGLKVAATLSVVGAVFGEWVGSSDGLGYLILTFNNQTATAEVFAAIAVLAAIGVAFFGLVSLLERLLLPWRPGATQRPM